MERVGKSTVLFPCVGCLGDGAGGNHVQKVLSLALYSRGGLMGCQAGVHIGHGHTYTKTNNNSGQHNEFKEFNECVYTQ